MKTLVIGGTGTVGSPIVNELLRHQYAGNDLKAWASQARQWLPGWLVDDWVQMYDLFQTQGLKATADQLDVLTKLLGRAPRSYGDFIKEHAGVFSRSAELV